MNMRMNTLPTALTDNRAATKLFQNLTCIVYVCAFTRGTNVSTQICIRVLLKFKYKVLLI